MAENGDSAESAGGVSPNEPLPFVLLFHQHPHGAHYDLLLYRDGVLKAWRLARLLDGSETEPLTAVELPDHRLRYLTFEGDIGPGRGRVRACLRGEYIASAWEADAVTLCVATPNFRAKYRLMRIAEDTWRMSREPKHA